MSASREKKQRQGAGPSVRDTQAQQEEAAYKRKAAIYTVIGVVVVVLVAALLIWNSGVFRGNPTAASVNGTSYTVSDVSYFYEQAKYQSNYIYYAYNMTQYIPADDDVQDESTGKTWREYYLDQALESMKEITALYDNAIQNGYSASDVADDVEQELQGTKDAAKSNGISYRAYLKARYGEYMSASRLEDVVTRRALAAAYYNDHSDSLTYGEDKIQAYYEENKNTLDTFVFSSLSFIPETVDTKDADGNDLSEEKQKELKDAALAKAKADAEAALASVQGGAKMEDVAKQYESSGSTFADHTSSLGSSLSSAYSGKLQSMEENETALAENGESGYYVVTLHSRYRDETPNADVRHILIKAEGVTDADGNTAAPTEEAWAAAQSKAEDVLSKYEGGEHTEAAFTALAKQYSDDVDQDGNPNNDALYANVSKQDSYVPEFLDWIFQDGGHSAGDTGIVKHDGGTAGYSGYHIMYYVADRDPAWKDTAVTTLRNADVSEWVDGLKSSYTGTLESGAQYVAQ